jgi:acetyltransferase
MKPISFTTKDGRRVDIRRLRDDDAALLVDMFHHLSDRTKRLRFHAYLGNVSEKRLWQEAMALSKLDPERQVALLAIAREEGAEPAVGVARLSRATAEVDEAEAAIVVRDDYQNAGLGTRLGVALIQVARSMGINRLFAWVMTENRQVLQMTNKLGLPIQQDTRAGETKIIVKIDEIDHLQAMLKTE